jgi:putative transferase (TIGR04331 family)
MSILLVTTALKKTWKNDKDLLFLGEWCKLYSDKILLKSINHSTIEYHWEDRKKFISDCEYLKDINERLIADISVILNKYHHVDFSIKYWMVVIGPWLAIFIPAIWDRWESVRVAYTQHNFENVCASDLKNYKFAMYDYGDSMSSLQEDEWNYAAFSQIIRHQYSNKCKIINVGVQLKVRESKSYKKNIPCLFDKFFALFQKNYKVVFVKSYLNIWALFKISLRLRQLPRKFCQFNNFPPPKKMLIRDRSLSLDLDCKNDFENFLSLNLFKHIPYNYLEGFESLYKKSDTLKFRGDIIFTANAHFSDDFFKVWCAKQIEIKKSKLLISSHGGAIPSLMSSFSNYEEKVSDQKIVWHKPIAKKHVRISSNKLVGRFRLKKIQRLDITIVSLDFGRYSYGAQSGPSSSLILEDFNQKLNFIKNIPYELQQYTKIFPYPVSPWNFQQRFSDVFGKKIISKYKDFNEAIYSSRIIVCTYPQTTFSEAMMSGIPTILLYTKKYWELAPEFDNLLSQLEEAKIVFSDPVLAANHISRVWGNPNKWWESKITIEARKKFFDDCLLVDKDWTSEWSLFFNQIQHSTKSLSHDRCK